MYIQAMFFHFFSIYRLMNISHVQSNVMTHLLILQCIMHNKILPVFLWGVMYDKIYPYARTYHLFHTIVILNLDSRANNKHDKNGCSSNTIFVENQLELQQNRTRWQNNCTSMCYETTLLFTIHLLQKCSETYKTNEDDNIDFKCANTILIYTYTHDQSYFN